MLSEIQTVAKVAEKACAAAINHPANIEVRRHLLDILDQMAELLSSAGYPDRLRNLHRQIGIWADIVRYRLDNTGSAVSVRRPARNLQRLLSQLVSELHQPIAA
jgi:hypothetical protein